MGLFSVESSLQATPLTLHIVIIKVLIIAPLNDVWLGDMCSCLQSKAINCIHGKSSEVVT